MLINPAPRPIAALGDMRPKASTCGKSHVTMPAATPPTTAHFSSALPSSDAPRNPNNRFNPLKGLMRVKSGVSAAGLKFHPPRAVPASTTTATSAAKIGKSADSASVAASRSEENIDCVSSSCCTSMDMKRRMSSAILPAKSELVAASATLPPIMAANVVSSRERGT